MNLVDRNRPIPLRELNRVADKARQSAHPSGAGSDCQMIGAIPIYSPSPERARYCTARITGVAVDGSSMPILDDAGNQQYTWIEEERYIDGSGFPAWRDATFDGARGSYQNGTGVYYGLAREANGQTAATNDHVIVYAALDNQSTAVGTANGVEHVFYGKPVVQAAIPYYRATWTVSEAQNTSGTINSSTGDLGLSTEVNSDVSIFSLSGSISVLKTGAYFIQVSAATDYTTLASGSDELDLQVGGSTVDSFESNMPVSSQAVFAMTISYILVVISAPAVVDLNLGWSAGSGGNYLENGEIVILKLA